VKLKQMIAKKKDRKEADDVLIENKGKLYK
jgi:hypothetical protein